MFWRKLCVGLLSSILTSGLAAKWNTASQSSITFSRLLGCVQSPMMRFTASGDGGFPNMWSMFSFEPAAKLSNIVTSHPSFRSLSERLEPMNPAPPVMNAFNVVKTLCREPFRLHRFQLSLHTLRSKLSMTSDLVKCRTQYLQYKRYHDS